jgi:hypothetical protein
MLFLLFFFFFFFLLSFLELLIIIRTPVIICTCQPGIVVPEDV